MPSKKQQRNRRKKALALRKINEIKEKEIKWKKTLKNLKYLPEELRLTIFHFVGVKSAFSAYWIIETDDGNKYRYDGTNSGYCIDEFCKSVIWKTMTISPTLIQAEAGKFDALAPRDLIVRKILSFSLRTDWWDWSYTAGRLLKEENQYIEIFKRCEERWKEEKAKLLKIIERNNLDLMGLDLENYVVLKNLGFMFGGAEL